MTTTGRRLFATAALLAGLAAAVATGGQRAVEADTSGRAASLALEAASTAAPGPDDWLQAAPGYAWSFPRDHFAHPPYRTEWWYVTGHLREAGAPADAEPVPFQFTLFRVGLRREGARAGTSAWHAASLVMGHAAVTDPAARRHVFSEVLWRASAGLGGYGSPGGFGSPGDTTLAWCLAPPGTPGRWKLDLSPGGTFRLRARDDHRGLGFELACKTDQAPVLQGPGGFSPKDAGGTAGSLYYSLPRLRVTGTLRRGDRDVAVTGEAWLDREIFTSTLTSAQAGWDWVSLQLDDGRCLMLYRLRRPDGAVDYALGTLIDAAGRATPLPREAWSLEPLRTWTSPATKSPYPVDWRLRVPSARLDVELRAVLDDQENVSLRTGVRYWEGGVRAVAAPGAPGAGRVVGRGFVELTGYGEGSRPPV